MIQGVECQPFYSGRAVFKVIRQSLDTGSGAASDFLAGD
jgi:hypothetical protein